MIRTVAGLFMTALLFILIGCSNQDSKKQEQGHTEEKTTQVTVWSKKTELFMEYAPLVSGKKNVLLIHLTRLADGKPVSEGALQLTLRPEAGQPVTITVTAPSRPGIYQAELSPAADGRYTLELQPQSPGFNDLIRVPGIVVGSLAAQPGAAKTSHQEQPTEKHDDHDGHGHDDHGHTAAPHDHAGLTAPVIGDGGGSISFLKGQQWSLDTLIRQPVRKQLSSRITAGGELIAASDAEATVAAPLSGIVSVSRPLPYLGKRVAKGELIALIDPPFRPEGGAGQLTAAHAEARSRVTLTRQEYERAQRLYEAKIAPRKRVEEAAAALDNARAALAPLEKSAALLGGDGNGRLAVRAPISGTVVEVLSGTGKGIEADQPLVRIVNTGTLWLKASLPALDAGKLTSLPSAVFTVAGQEGSFTTGRLISVGDMLDPQSRTLPVIFSVPNPGSRLKVGMFATVSVTTGEAQEGLVLPLEALVEDEGRFFLFVQTAGERFSRREVQIGAKQDGQVQVLKGLDEHDRVVVQGVYYVKQAATGSRKEDPHAGHAH